MVTNRPAALALAAIVFMALPLVAADVSIEQSSSSSVQQDAQVSGDNTRIEQESTVETENNDEAGGVHTEQTITREGNESAQVERNVERFGDNISYDVEQFADETGSGITASQQVTGEADNEDTAEVGEEAESASVESGTETAAADETDVAVKKDGPVTVFVKTVASVGNAIISLFSF